MSAKRLRILDPAGVGVLAALATGALLFFGCQPNPPTNPAATPPDPGLVGPPYFFKEIADSGIDVTYDNGEDVKNDKGELVNHLAILESLGGGVALIDYDGDGLLDVFVPGGGTYEGPDHKQIVGRPCKLFKNLGNFKFKDVTKEVGLDKLAGDQPWFYTHAAAVADYDRDGWPDLLVTGWGRVALFHNVPVDPTDPKKGRKFEDVSEKSGLKAITWATSAAFADFDGDGYPDLYICQYVDWSWNNHPTDCNYGKKVDGKFVRDVCPPKQFKGLRHKLFANNGKDAKDAIFRDVTEEANLKAGGPDSSKGLGVIAGDFNDDGKPDIYVCNDTVDKFLYINECTKGKFKFKETALLAGAARDDRGNANGSMGCDVGDPDGTGKATLWVTNYENEMHGYYRNRCEGKKVFFTHSTAAAGIAAIGQKYVAWGTGFVDLDHHGWEDLFIVNGHAIRFPTGDAAARREKPVLLYNLGEGKFRVATKKGGSYFDSEHLARGAALGDLDNDGFIDAVVSHMNDPVAVLRNVSDAEGTHWYGVRLLGKGNADVVGTKVILEAGGRKQTRWAKGGGSYASAPDKRMVFGLVKTDKVDKLTVVWPDRTTQEFKDLTLDGYHDVVQEQGGEGADK
jgi:hypothetical protein